MRLQTLAVAYHNDTPILVSDNGYAYINKSFDFSYRDLKDGTIWELPLSLVLATEGLLGW